uniref:Bacterial transcriptional activator domain-containing protein n=1 Tax=uncultured Armatimonadetes bacterium TaxID=157466 RepID=A0A6J4IZP8_9BACT|nr:hypothetical protein AVDCRST_MAG63-2647 [uncultured Armatimonadetes bacterium]
MALSSLRHQLEPPGVPGGTVLQADRFSVRLNPDAVSADVTEFDAAVTGAARPAAAAERVRLLEAAVRLYQGEFLPGYYDDWVLEEQRRLAEAFVGAAHGLVRELEKAGDVAGALEHARHAVQVEPMREEFRRDLMRLLASSGDREGIDAALRQFNDWDRRGAQEGWEPGPALRQYARDLERRAQASPAAPEIPRRVVEGSGGAPAPVVPSRTPEGFPPAEAPHPRAEVEHAGRLPLQVTRFFGREEEIARLAEMLSPCGPVALPPDDARAARLVTLTGPGGTGKTRLSLAVAERLRSSYRGAVWFVPLADLANARLIPGAVVDALGIPRSLEAGRLEQAEMLLAAQPSLLVLDNFEHLVRQGGALVRTLLARLPTLTCLVTSRQPLHVTGEREYPLLPLPVPRTDEDADRMSRVPSVQLFVDRAQAVRPDFQLTPGNAPAVAELCTRLDGMPLAVELAAARVQVLTARQMVTQLDRRFELLVSRKRDISERHRTLWAAINWSYGLLTPDLQKFFRRLSVFRGGWTLEAAETVSGDPDGPVNALDGMSHLRDCSLILAEEIGPEMRFRMIESLRDYGEERLREAGEADRIRDRHRDFHLRLAEAAEAPLRGPRQAEWLGRLEAEYDNIQAALEWSLNGSPEAGLRLAGALWQFWLASGRLGEGRERLRTVLSRTDPSDRSAPRAKALNGAGVLAYVQGDYEGARVLHEEGLAIWRESGDRQHLSYALLGLGFVETAQENYDRAGALYDECLPLFREYADVWGVAWTLNNMGNVAWHRGDVVRARALYEESLALKRELGDPYGLADSLGNLALAASGQGDHTTARALYQESLTIWRDLGDRRGVAAALEGLAGLEAAKEAGSAGDAPGSAAERAACLAGAAEALRRSIGARLSPSDLAQNERALAPARAALAPDAFRAALAAGAALSLEAAVAYAVGAHPE